MLIVVPRVGGRYSLLLWLCDAFTASLMTETDKILSLIVGKRKRRAGNGKESQVRVCFVLDNIAGQQIRKSGCREMDQSRAND